MTNELPKELPGGFRLSNYGTSSGAHSVGVAIYIKLDRPNEDEDRRRISPHREAIHETLLTLSEERDPEGPARRANLQSEIEAVFLRAGLGPIFVEEIPNVYDLGWCGIHRPWFMVTTPIGHIKIGWRKSVLNIDWSRSVVRGSGLALFPNEDVTRGAASNMGGERYIHAWSYEKAIEYLSRLRRESYETSSSSR